MGLTTVGSRQQRLRLAIVRSFGRPLDAARYNVQELGLAAALNELGIEVHVFMMGDRGSPSSTVWSDVSGCRTTLHLLRGLRGPGGQAYYPGLAARLEDCHCDIVQVQEDNQLTSCIVSRWARAARKPAILCQGMYEDYRGLVLRTVQTAYDHLALPVLRRSVTACLAKSEAAAAYLERKGFDNVRVLPVGLDTRRFSEGTHGDWRLRSGISKESVVLLYVGVIEPRRRLDVVVPVVAELAAEGFDVHLVVVGSGPDEARVKEQARSLIPERVHWLGKLEQEYLPAVYESADLVLLPTEYEIYGMVALESLFFGTPVAASEVGGLRDILRDCGGGVLVPANTGGCWLQAIRAFLALDIEESAVAREKARERGHQLTWQALAPRYREFYEGIAHALSRKEHDDI